MHPATPPLSSSLSIGQCATLACLLEVTAAKPGNVHRGADFDDATFADFAISAVAIGPAMERAAVDGQVGDCVLAAVQATQQLVATNTNLGTVLLLAPLAAVPRDAPIHQGIQDVLDRLTTRDAALVYDAIRLARPGGLGTAVQHDIDQPPPDDLLVAMRAAGEHDLVARQYVDRFSLVREVAGRLAAGCERGWTLLESIVEAHVWLMSEFPDSLIARKCGAAVADESAARAAHVSRAGAPGDEAYQLALADLDFWLRCDGHRRNPGTTADLIAAGLFVGLHASELSPSL